MEVMTTIDARGLACPMPIVRLSQALAGLETGQIVKVLATDSSFVPDIEAWCRKTGHELVDITESKEEITVQIKKTK